MGNLGAANPPPEAPVLLQQGPLARAGGWLLLGSGLFIVAAYVALTISAPPTTQGWAFFFAPLFLAIGAVPLAAGIGAVKRRRKAQIGGAIVGWVYGGLLLVTGLTGPTGFSPLSVALALPFVLGALCLTLAVSGHDMNGATDAAPHR